MRKVCFVVSAPITAKVFLSEHFKYLSTQFEITLVGNFEEVNEKEFPYVSNIQNISIYRDISIIKDLIALFRLFVFFRNEKFEIVHSVTPKAGLIGILAAKMAGVKFRIHIFTGQVWHTSTGLKKLFLKLLDKIIVHFATNILVDGQSQRHFLIRNRIIKKGNSLVLGKGSISGVDLGRFIPTEKVRRQYRDQLGFGKEDVVFLFLGRLNRDKGVLDLAMAFKKLEKKIGNVKLLMIGADEENIRSQIVSLEINNVYFVDHTSKPEEFLQVGDVFCLPSYREGFGTSVIEASLLGLPIICSDTYGLAETIIDGETGLRHKVKDINGIFDCMYELAVDPEKRLLLGRNGRKYVMENFSSKMISEEWLNYYKNLV